jgi:hypothetical protein
VCGRFNHGKQKRRSAQLERWRQEVFGMYDKYIVQLICVVDKDVWYGFTDTPWRDVR